MGSHRVCVPKARTTIYLFMTAARLPFYPHTCKVEFICIENKKSVGNWAVRACFLTTYIQWIPVEHYPLCGSVATRNFINNPHCTVYSTLVLTYVVWFFFRLYIAKAPRSALAGRLSTELQGPSADRLKISESSSRVTKGCTPLSTRHLCAQMD